MNYIVCELPEGDTADGLAAAGTFITLIEVEGIGFMAAKTEMEALLASKSSWPKWLQDLVARGGEIKIYLMGALTHRRDGQLIWLRN